MTQKEEIIKIIDEYVQELIGDTSVQNQLNIALNNHTHENYVTRTEYEKSDIGKLLKHRDDVDTKKPKKKSRKNEIAFIERF